MTTKKDIAILASLFTIIILGIITIIACGVLSLAKGKDDQSDLQTLMYEGHRFILYDGGSCAGGIIHHPDCGCRKMVQPEH
jgi:hypothetical protein